VSQYYINTALSTFSWRTVILHKFSKDLPATERIEQPVGPTETDTSEVGENPEPTMVKIVFSS
jgi:hypothetical protein